MRLIAIAALFWAYAASAFAAVEETTAHKLSGEDLQELFSGADWSGCYSGERPGWAERTAADGSLYDLNLASAPLVGTWEVIGDVICYVYAEDHPIAGWHCFTAQRLEPSCQLRYYSYQTGDLVAYTPCNNDLVS